MRAFYDRAEGAEDGTFRLEVEDTGCGIAPEDLKRIGTDYVQVGFDGILLKPVTLATLSRVLNELA